jgi:acid stress-induced BolA-like protein IbaG/YrbA
MSYNATMSVHLTTFQGSIPDAIRNAIVAAIADAQVEVTGGGGHYVIAVTSTAFAGKGMLACHRLVYAAIAPLMEGEGAPVHAVDSLTTRTPD